MSGMDDKLIKAMAELDEKAVLKLVKEELSQGLEPLSILKQIQTGIEKVGELYEKGEYFIADLIMSGIIFNNVLKIEEMNLYTTESKKCKIGKVLLGTAKSDLHDIGKNVFGSMMKMAGFEVLDLGVDVAPETFVARIKEFRPQIVGISGVLIVALEGMKETVELITAAGLRDSVKIILGGTIVKNGVDFIGADAYTVDPSEGVKLCLDWFEA
ncbi:methanogenic corrinoid protein MtbC1 [Desulfitobacterium sp. LBE]|uniref:Methyltransferase corrinoid protein n=3 Tax=Desulfitobacterium TaxID=36853 RepID=A0A098B7T8_DESHA|nr:cobalamin B12-binding domain protein [Desulfitobacterium hafniense DCB-2]TWH57494.1 methanogenic corrinoid protein MtbC1 [Desulfitobacterium sp. LBE]CDX03911.1 methyltransferase corrinoid protein [Desulfitobacterium hafniense]SHN60405.1 Methanogenic corrinoid protein MtbC1 [Desulfitobacterium chlororespirans DSM 11544]